MDPGFVGLDRVLIASFDFSFETPFSSLERKTVTEALGVEFVLVPAGVSSWTKSMRRNSRQSKVSGLIYEIMREYKIGENSDPQDPYSAGACICVVAIDICPYIAYVVPSHMLIPVARPMIGAMTAANLDCPDHISVNMRGNIPGHVMIGLK